MRTAERFSSMSRQVPVTKLQQKALDFVADYIQKSGQSPTFAEIGQSLGYKKAKAATSASSLLASLRRRGLVTWGSRAARSISICNGKANMTSVSGAKTKTSSAKAGVRGPRGKYKPRVKAQANGHVNGHSNGHTNGHTNGINPDTLMASLRGATSTKASVKMTTSNGGGDGGSLLQSLVTREAQLAVELEEVRTAIRVCRKMSGITTTAD